MTVKEWLNMGRRLDAEVVELLEARQRSLDLACGGSVDMSNDKVQTSKQNATERKWIAYVDYVQLINTKVNELVSHRHDMLRMINLIDNSTYRTLLIARYINCKTWEQVADDMDYDLRWIHRLHGKSLQAIESHYKHVI